MTPLKKQLQQMLNYPLMLGLACSLTACSNMGSKKSSNSNKELDQISLDVQKKVLKNGLTVLVMENDKLPIFSYYTYYRVGGKYETKGITGSTHYLEHMMFKGAKKYGPGEFDKLVEGNGGSNNAYTTNDLTVYYESLPSEHIDTTIDLEADRMQNLALHPVSFESERNVILEERKMRYENSDRGKIYLKMMKEMFFGTPYGTSVIGKIQDIETVTRDQMMEYFKKFYAPNNAVIVIVGDVDADDVFDQIEKKFGSIEPNRDLDMVKKDIIKERKGFEFKGSYNRWVKINGTSPDPKFMLAYKGVKIGPRDAYVLDILSSILGDGASSYLHQNFVTSRSPIMSSVYAANYTLMDSGVFFIGGGLLKGKNLNNARRVLLKKVRVGCHDAVNERSVQKIKNQYLVQMLSGLDTNAGVARFIGDREIFYGDYNFYKKEFSIYNSVSVEELKAACDKYLKKENSIFLSIWNKHRK
jgi:zinc protease